MSDARREGGDGEGERREESSVQHAVTKRRRGAQSKRRMVDTSEEEDGTDRGGWSAESMVVEWEKESSVVSESSGC